MIFQSLIREEIEAQFEAAKKEDNNLGNVDKFRFVTNQFSKRWRALTDQQKQVYSDLSSKEKEEATKKQVAWVLCFYQSGLTFTNETTPKCHVITLLLAIIF